MALAAQIKADKWSTAMPNLYDQSTFKLTISKVTALLEL